MPASTLVLLNRRAGSVRSDARCLSDVLEHGALDGAEIRAIGDPSSIPELIAAGLDAGVELVVAGGGDGTINAVANELLAGADGGGDGSPATLAVLPLGTANDFARSIGVQDLQTALDAVAAARRGATPSRDRVREGADVPGIVRCDVIRASFDGGEAVYALNVLVAGFGGRVQDGVTDELKARWGPLAYLVGGLGAFDPEGHAATLRIDDGPPSEVDIFNLAVANGRFAGGGYEAAPEATPDDGRLEVVVASPVNLRELAVLASYVRRGEPEEHDSVTLRGARRIRIETSEPLTYSLDGEQQEARKADIQVAERVLPIVVGGGEHV